MACPVLSIAATPTPFRITYRAAAPCLSRIEAGTCRKLKCSMHLTGAHVFTDGQPFTLTASISPLTVRRIPRYETVAPSLVRVERFVAVSTSGVAVDRQWTVEILQRNFISVPLDPRTRTGDEFARSSSRSRSRSARAERVAESLVDASLHIRGTEQRGFLVRWKNTLCSSSANIILGAGCFSRPGTTGSRGFRRVFVLSRRWFTPRCPRSF